MQSSSSTETNVSEKTLIYGVERKSKYHFIPFTKREYFLLALLLLVFVIFFILFMFSVSIHIFSPSVLYDVKENKICTNGPCLEISSFILNNMNTTLNPCDDFYKYVCGNFLNNFPATKMDINFFTLIGERNKPRFHELLLQDPQLARRFPNSAEWKIKQFYQSCLYGYQTIKNGGQPLLEILDDVGGWHILETWNQSNFDLDKLFQQVHVKYWSPAIFDINYIADPENRNKSLLTLKKVYHTPVHQPDFFMKMESSYRRFVQTIVSMLIRDLKMEVNQNVLAENINEFLDDQLAFLEKLNECTHSLENSGESLKAITVEILQQRSPVIRWKEFLQLKTDDHSINEETKIYSSDWNYIYNVSKILQQSSERTLQNFFIWIILEEYTQDLSFDYLYESYLYKTEVYTSAFRSYDQKDHCFNLLRKHMGDILSHTFVSRLVGNEVKDELKSLVETINYHGTESISKFSWLKEADKAVIKKRVEERTFLGASKSLPNIEDMDEYYSVIQFKEKDYFYNRLQLNNLHHHNFAKQAMDPSDDHPNIGDLYLDYNFWQNHWYIPEEILQFPMFDKKYPNYLKYGGIGYILCFLNNYDLLETVRSEDTDLTEKLMNLGRHINLAVPERDITVYYENEFHQLPTNRGYNYNAAITYAYSYLTVRHLYKIYKSWVNENEVEDMLPGIPVNTTEQAFFLFMTAAGCSSFRSETEYMYSSNSITNIRNSAIFHSVPEFLEAFNCPKSKSYQDDIMF